MLTIHTELVLFKKEITRICVTQQIFLTKHNLWVCRKNRLVLYGKEIQCYRTCKYDYFRKKENGDVNRKLDQKLKHFQTTFKLPL